MENLQICCVLGWPWIYMHAGLLLTHLAQLVRMDTKGLSKSYLTNWNILDFNFKINNINNKHNNLTNQKANLRLILNSQPNQAIYASVQT